MVKILIAEDEEPIANLIRMNLKKAGYYAAEDQWLRAHGIC